MDYFNDALFWALNVVVSLLSDFIQKYLNLCSEDDWMYYGFGMTELSFLGELSL